LREASRARAQEPHVDIRILSFVFRFAGSYFKHDRVPRRSILQMVTVFDSRFKASAIAGAKDFFAGIGDQHHLALDDEYKLILCSMPMPLTGPSSSRQAHQIHSKVTKA